MIIMKIFSEDVPQGNRLKRVIDGYNRLAQEDYIQVELCSERKKWKEAGDADLIFVDYGKVSDLKWMQMIRRLNPQVELVLFSDGILSAEACILPEIRPLSLLKKSAEEEELVSYIRKLCHYLMEKCESRTFTHRFSSHDGTERRIFPCSAIRYFETRNKKIVLYTRSGEYEFYDTFAHMETVLPAEFVRCHRSFIVNATYIMKVDLAHLGIELADGSRIPISRKYRRQMERVCGICREDTGEELALPEHVAESYGWPVYAE